MMDNSDWINFLIPVSIGALIGFSCTQLSDIFIWNKACRCSCYSSTGKCECEICNCDCKVCKCESCKKTTNKF